MLCGGGAADYLAFAQKSGLSAAAVIKLGSHGAAMQVNGTTYKVSSPVVDVVDTTGAGDAFNAGFIDALLDEAAPEDCLRRACICGGAFNARVEEITACHCHAARRSSIFMSKPTRRKIAFYWWRRRPHTACSLWRE